jgi:hypothetical protein
MSVPFGSQVPPTQEAHETAAQKPSGLIDPGLNISNPGSYEELHKKAKGI